MMFSELNERQRHLWCAAEAIALGHGGIAPVCVCDGNGPQDHYARNSRNQRRGLPSGRSHTKNRRGTQEVLGILSEADVRITRVAGINETRSAEFGIAADTQQYANFKLRTRQTWIRLFSANGGGLFEE